MKRTDRRRSRPAVQESLEPRMLLSTLLAQSERHHPIKPNHAHPNEVRPANVPGNGGEIVQSQFQAHDDGELAYQWWRLALGGPLSVQNITPNDPTTAEPARASRGTRPTASGAVNKGLIAKNQFNSSGFPTVGVQLKAVRLGGGLTLLNYDEAGATPLNLLGAPANTGAILGGQFNDGGFGKIGVQATSVAARGSLTIANHIYLRGSDGRSLPTSTTTTTPLGATPNRPDLRSHASSNSNVIRHTQFNDGGFGDIGLQLRRVLVGGSIGINAEKLQIEPTPVAGTITQTGTGVIPAPSSEVATPTNTGQIGYSQFSDGGFGDNGFQWDNVLVGGSVAISKNNLEIQPESGSGGPINAGNLVFGTGDVVAPIAVATPVPPGVVAQPFTAAVQAAATPKHKVKQAAKETTNDATNSGRLVNTQFNDGGFGDVGAQWRDVRVRHGVSSVQNSLSIQPENTAQGQITVHDVQFPSTPVPAPAPAPGPLHMVSPDPQVIQHDGAHVRLNLPKATHPGATPFSKNEATNSGIVNGSQFNDGGFGDIGLQWAHVRVAGKVQLVHNSLSVQPEGQELDGVNVSNITYGTPDTSQTNPALATLPSATISPNGPPTTAPHPHPTNKAVLVGKQFPSPIKSDVSLQWNDVYRDKGVVIVHNAIIINAVAPSTGPIQLNNIKFPGRIPPITYNSPGTAAFGVGAAADKSTPSNSGIVASNQFNDGSFGDIGTQLRRVKIAGNVRIVHNDLAVGVTGANTGPINISNVVFHSGALDGGHARAIVSPPIYRSQIPGPRPKLGSGDSLNVPTNSGILKGGQFSSGGFGHIMLQLQRVGIRGPVTIVDNVISIGASGTNTGPITISNVTFS